MTLTTEASARIETTNLPLELTPELAELRERARRFVDEVLIPLEQEAERLNGRLPAETIERIKREAIDARLNGGLHSPDYGGQGWSRIEWALVEEQFGRSTNGIYWHIPNAYNVWDNASEAQRERYLRPAIAGRLKDAYAVTEAGAGSDPSRIESTAERSDAGYRINGEKWFVTSGDVAQILIVMANVLDGADSQPTLFLVQSDADGVEYVDDPGFTHNYPEGHPTIRFTDVEVADDAVVGAIGAREVRLGHRQGAAADAKRRCRQIEFALQHGRRVPRDIGVIGRRGGGRDWSQDDQPEQDGGHRRAEIEGHRDLLEPGPDPGRYHRR